MDIDWKAVGTTAGKFAPMLGALLGGPAGASVGAMIASALGTGNTPMEVQQALVTNPDAAVKEIESTRQVSLQALMVDSAKAELAAATANAADINKTMQAEAAAEHWPTYSWRPAIGFAVALAILLSVLAVFMAYAAALHGRNEGLQQLPGILAAVAGIIGVASPILGIASWFRGKMQADPSVPTVNRG
jgi:roadblock/LC7 domain-containing protein